MLDLPKKTIVTVNIVPSSVINSNYIWQFSDFIILASVSDALHPSINIHHDIMCVFKQVIFSLTVVQ
jgi:hypothetical protein